MAPNSLLHLPNKEEQILQPNSQKRKKKKNQGNPPLPPPPPPLRGSRPVGDKFCIKRKCEKFYFFYKNKIKNKK